ncbi:2TM domain-containing protein [Patiriisocius hiemis]|uniref:2TM domain-containing protein n=1 Tax=Patiriisocius hiemis TaxID=3075604 RepID=A0ABU2YBK0_9FLAO|nr:2TM domain-containing protein [Constantimarinum sp. W242]MDT0554428.1 2TM domain-containing protein [Constantimarinum sp. W242]
MEIDMDKQDHLKYKKAQKKVTEIRGFYTHLGIYLVVNLLLLAANLGLFSNSPIKLWMPGWAYFTTPFFWGIWLVFHGISVFGPKIKIGFIERWEQRKINEFMDNDDTLFNTPKRWN